MKPKTLIPLVMGVVVAGVAIKIVVDVVDQAQGKTQANMEPCVVAKMDIEFAEEITPEKLAVKDWPKDALPQQHFASVEDLIGRVTSIHIPKDVPVFPRMLAPPGTPPGLQTRIPNGFRAVSVAIDEISGVAYQLHPGDHVDVVSLIKRPRRDGRGFESMSRIILQNVEVAAVGRTLSASAKTSGTKTAVARSATLVLQPEDVTKLHLAQASGGKISLALRGSMDRDQQVVKGSTFENLLGLAAEPEPLAPPSAPEESQDPRPDWEVTVVQGNEMRQIAYQRVDGEWRLMGVRDWSGPASQRADGAEAGG